MATEQQRDCESPRTAASAVGPLVVVAEPKPTMPSWWEAGSFWCAVCQTEDADFANEAAPGVCRWCMPFMRKKWRRWLADAEGRVHFVTEAAYVDGFVIQLRRAYWARVRPLQAEVPVEFFARAPVERWRGSGTSCEIGVR